MFFNFREMNRRKLGAKISKIANFTFQQLSSNNFNSSEENNNKINNNGKNNNLNHENKSTTIENNNIDLDKGKKRLPLVFSFFKFFYQIFGLTNSQKFKFLREKLK